MKNAAQQGFSLIELMVSVAIGLIVTLAITGVLVASEQRKRTSTSVNDVNQTGAYISYVLDKAIRSAGSGFSEKSAAVFGCALKASRNGAQNWRKTSLVQRRRRRLRQTRWVARLRTSPAVPWQRRKPLMPRG